MAMAAVAAAAVGAGAYEARKGRKAASKGMSAAQQTMCELLEAYGGMEGLQKSLDMSEQRLMESQGVVQSGFRKAGQLVSSSRKKQLAAIADTERKMQIAQARAGQAAAAAGLQKAGVLGQVSTAGSAAMRGMALDSAAAGERAAMSSGSARQNVEASAGATNAELALKGAAANAAILGQLSQFQANKASAIQDIQTQRGQMLAGFAQSMPQSQGLNLGGLGQAMAMMSNLGGSNPSTIAPQSASYQGGYGLGPYQSAAPGTEWNPYQSGPF